MSSRKKIVVVNPKKFTTTIAAGVALIVVLALLIIAPWKDSVKKDIEKLEGGKVDVIGISISAYDSQGNEVTDNTVYNQLYEQNEVFYKAVYNYQTKDGTVKNYPVSKDVKISVSDTAYATVVGDSASIQIPSGIISDHELTVTVKYKNKESVFKYTVKAPVPTEEE